MTNTIFKKTILAAIIAIAFVAGSITTGTLAFADEKTLAEICDKQAGKDSFKGLVCSALFDLENQIDDISQGVQVDQDGNTVLSNDLQVTGDTFLGDTTIASDLIVGPTNIDSVTGDVEVGGAFTCTGCIGATALAAGVGTGGGFTQVQSISTSNIGAVGPITCDSDEDFIVYVIVGSPAVDGSTITISDNTTTVTIEGDRFSAAESGAPGFGGTGYSGVIPAEAATTITVDGTGADDALVSLVTTSTATADCV